jgi:hypothetical protein
VAMTFTLMYSGEHYFIDVLVGWGYVVAIFVVVGLGEAWWRNRRAAVLARGPGRPVSPGAPDAAEAAPLDTSESAGTGRGIRIGYRRE